MSYRRILTSAVPVILSAKASAQGPLSIEQLIVESSALQLATTVDIRSSMNPEGHVRGTALSTALRYGVTADVEVNVVVAKRSQQGGFGQQVSSRTLSLGANWQVLREGRFPGLVLEGRLDMQPDRDSGRGTFSGGAIAGTLYRSTDPVVLSLSAVYSKTRPFEAGGLVVAPEGSVRIEPMVNFALNPEVTLFGGVALQHQGALRVGGQTAQDSVQNILMRGGFGWSPARHSMVFVTGEVSGTTEGSGASLQWLYQF